MSGCLHGVHIGCGLGQGHGHGLLQPVHTGGSGLTGFVGGHAVESVKPSVLFRPNKIPTTIPTVNIITSCKTGNFILITILFYIFHNR